MSNTGDLSEGKRPEFTVAFLKEISAGCGGYFLLGSWGMVKITIHRTNQKSKGGYPIWTLRMAEETPPEESDDESDSGPAPEFTVAFMHELEAKRGGIYLLGRLGRATVKVLKTTKQSRNGYPIWTMRLSEEPDNDADERW